MVATIVAWVVAHWLPVAVAILGVDAALIPLFPNAGILVAIKNFLTPVVPKS